MSELAFDHFARERAALGLPPCTTCSESAGEGCSTLHSGLLRSRIIVAPSDDAAADNESADDEP